MSVPLQARTMRNTIFYIALLSLATVADVTGQINFNFHFPLKETLPPPEACPEGRSYCGGEANKYPKDAINAIVEKTLDLQKSTETKSRFFNPMSKVIQDVGNSKDDIIPACKSKKDEIPLFSRAKNIEGNWMYLAQTSEGQTQSIAIITCENPDQPCTNDVDSPHGHGTTSCKQLHRSHKLLALGENGELVVDTFELPSACICNSKAIEFGVRRPSFRIFEDPINETIAPEEPEVSCVDDNKVSEPLETRFDRRFSSTPSHDMKASAKPEIVVEPCDKNKILGDSDVCNSVDRYPVRAVRGLLRRHEFGSPPQFRKLFGKPCTVNETPRLALRFGQIDSREPLCTGEEVYIFPKKARNIQGKWRYIVNTEAYQQGVTATICKSSAIGNSCKYGALEGFLPEATECRQQYIRHNMLAVVAQDALAMETFLIPSACICHLRKPEVFPRRRK